MYSNLADKEVDVIAAIQGDSRITQRQIANAIGISLGLTNILIKNLLAKGLINVRKINRKRVNYILTREGIRAKSRRVYNYFKRTIHAIGELKSKIEKIVLEQVLKNSSSKKTNINILGTNELADITEIALKDLQHKHKFSFQRINLSKDIVNNAEVVLVCENKYKNIFSNQINLEKVLSR